MLKELLRRLKMAKKKGGSQLISVKTEAKYLRISPRKLRLICDAIRDLKPAEAMKRLRLLNKKGARLLLKSVKTAISDAKNNFKLNETTLSFKKIFVGEGPRLKRIDRSHGARFNQGIIQKRMSHLVIVVEGEKQDGTKS